MARVDEWQLTRSGRFRLQDARESQQRSGRDGQGLGQPRKNRCAGLPSVETGLGPSRDSGKSLGKIDAGLQFERSPTSAATNSANSRTSSSVVSNEHIQRTTDSSSLHT
jgi:hypothetical protein